MVIISNGFNKFHLAVAAGAVSKRGELDILITGAYPYRQIQSAAGFLGVRHARVLKFYDRLEALAQGRVHANFASETMYFAQYPLRKMRGFGALARWLDRTSFRFYGWESAAHLAMGNEHSPIFHYRAGFGHAAARRARENGMVLVCDHSLVHPALLEFLVKNRGRFPADRKAPPVSSYWRGPVEDIDRADYILVNSEFVRDTFLWMGYPQEKIEVIYWGIDDQFFREIPARSADGEPKAAPLRLLFAGMFEARKGAEEIAEALEALPGCWTLDIVGQIAKDGEAHAKRLSNMGNVRFHRPQSRRELAKMMAVSDLFIFPSRAEGSARVIFEAMACGCAIVTTANSGSIVKDGRQGWLVEPGNAPALRAALRSALAGRDRVRAIGADNAALVASAFTQERYGKRLMDFYAGIAGEFRRPSVI